MSKRKSGDHAAESPSPPEIVCILVVDAIIDEFEVEICCQRTDGVDRGFSTSMDWLRAERPSEYRELNESGEFVIPGFAKMSVVNKPATEARSGVNPFTKEPMEFAAKPASKSVKASPLKVAKDAV